MRGHRISECLCFHQQSCSLDWWGDCGWGIRYKSAVLLCGWLLACYARIPTMSLLPCLRTEFSQRRLTSAVKGQPRDVFILITQLAWLVTKAPYHLHTHMRMRTHPDLWPLPAVHHLFQPNLFQVMHFKHTDAHLYSPTTRVFLLPIKIWRMKTVRLSFLPWHRGSLGNIQTALPWAMKSNRNSLQS